MNRQFNENIDMHLPKLPGRIVQAGARKQLPQVTDAKGRPYVSSDHSQHKQQSMTTKPITPPKQQLYNRRKYDQQLRQRSNVPKPLKQLEDRQKSPSDRSPESFIDFEDEQQQINLLSPEFLNEAQQQYMLYQQCSQTQQTANSKQQIDGYSTNTTYSYPTMTHSATAESYVPNDYYQNTIIDDFAIMMDSDDDTFIGSQIEQSTNRSQYSTIQSSTQGTTNLQPILEGKHNQDNTLQVEEEFKNMILNEINSYYKREFSNIRDAIAFYKQYTYENKTKMTLNFKTIADHFGWSMNTCYQKFDSLQQKVLDKYDVQTITNIKRDIQQYFGLIKGQCNYEKKKISDLVKKYIYEKYQIHMQFSKNQRQVNNVINYQIVTLLKQCKDANEYQ